MRKIIGSLFQPLDGMIQAPGGPEEDQSGCQRRTFIGNVLHRDKTECKRQFRAPERASAASISTGATNSAIWDALPNAMPMLRSSRFCRAPENADAISAAARQRALMILRPQNLRARQS
jgi:hypothetical protein